METFKKLLEWMDLELTEKTSISRSQIFMLAEHQGISEPELKKSLTRRGLNRAPVQVLAAFIYLWSIVRMDENNTEYYLAFFKKYVELCSRDKVNLHISLSNTRLPKKIVHYHGEAYTRKKDSFLEQYINMCMVGAIQMAKLDAKKKLHLKKLFFVEVISCMEICLSKSISYVEAKRICPSKVDVKKVYKELFSDF